MLAPGEVRADRRMADPSVGSREGSEAQELQTHNSERHLEGDLRVASRKGTAFLGKGIPL